MRGHPFADDGNLIQFSDGFPISRQVTISEANTSSFGNEFSFGTATHPIDLDHYNVSVQFVNTDWDVTLFDQDFDNTNQPFSFFTSNGGDQQHVQKGGFQIAMSNNFWGKLRVEGGTTGDRFGVGGVMPGADLVMLGNDGDDEWFTDNSNGHDNDLDDVIPFDSVNFLQGSVQFVGGNGSDLIELNDSSDQTGDGDQNYTFNRNSSLENIVKSGAHGSVPIYFDRTTTESVLFDADADNNTIAFATYPNQFVSIDGGSGNDLFKLADTIELQDCLGTASLIGGAGNDSFSVSDDNPSFQSLTQYLFFTGGLLYMDAAQQQGGIVYDSTLESFIVDENDAGANTIISGKRSTVQLTINGRGGDDRFVFGGGDLDSSGLMSGGVTITGGTGEDNITFDDHLDDQSDGATSNYTMTANTFAKGALSVVYTTYETQALLSANGVVSGQSNSVPIVNLNVVSAFLDTTTIVGGAARGCTLNVAGGNLNNLSGLLVIQDCTTVNINDQSSTSNNTYQLTATQLSRNNFTFATYSGVGTMTLNAGSGIDTISVLRSPLGTSLTVNGDAGISHMFLGNGNIDTDLRGPVTMNGSNGTDLTIDNHLDTTSETQTLNTFDFVDSGISYGYSISINGALTVKLGSGGTNFTMTGQQAHTTVLGGAGNDTFTVGGGNIAGGFRSQAANAPFFDGGGGTDSIILNDFNAPAAGSYEFERPNGIDRLDRGNGDLWYINWANMELATLEASDAPTTGNGLVGEFVDDLQTPLRINGNGGSDAVFVFDSAFPVFVNTGAGTMDELYVNFDAGAGDAPATVVVDQNDEIDLLDVRAGGTLRVTSGATLAKSHLNGTSSLFSVVGTIDLAGGALLSRAGGPTSSQFQTWLTRGFNAGSWNGTNAGGAINSSLAHDSTLPDAVGYGLGSDIAISSIGGFTVAPGDMLVRYTWYGDADLNGRVNFDDYVRTDNGFNNHHTGWTNGDFDYNGAVNFDDYVLIDLGFNSQ
jgi:hypothetical protein